MAICDDLQYPCVWTCVCTGMACGITLHTTECLLDVVPAQRSIFAVSSFEASELR